jgi:hypothetical protein
VLPAKSDRSTNNLNLATCRTPIPNILVAIVTGFNARLNMVVTATG